jgi:hypothetical protein
MQQMDEAATRSFCAKICAWTSLGLMLHRLGPLVSSNGNGYNNCTCQAHGIVSNASRREVTHNRRHSPEGLADVQIVKARRQRRKDSPQAAAQLSGGMLSDEQLQRLLHSFLSAAGPNQHHEPRRTGIAASRTCHHGRPGRHSKSCGELAAAPGALTGEHCGGRGRHCRHHRMSICCKITHAHHSPT